MATKLTDEELSEYIADMKKANPTGLSPQEWSEYEADVRAQHGQTTTDKALAMGGKAVDVGLRGLDYLGGLARTGVFDALSSSDRVKLEDYMKALKGQAPSSAEFLERKGVKEGMNLSDVAPSLYSESGDEWDKLQKGGAADPSARGTLGFAADLALDPLNYLSLGGTAAARAGARAATKSAGREVAKRTTKDRAKDLLSMIARPGDNLLQSTGRKMYKSTFKDIDDYATRYGKPPVSDLLFSKGIGGTKTNIANRVVDEMQRLDGVRDPLLRKGDKLGATVSMEMAMQPALDLADDLITDPGTRDIGKALRTKAEEYIAEGPQNLSTASKWKSTINNSMPNSAWDAATKTNPGKRGAKTMGSGLKTGVEDSANLAEPGLGDQIRTVNDEWGQLLTSVKGIKKEALRDSKKKYLTDADIVTGLIAMGGTGPFGGGAALTMKKSLDLSRGAWAKTRSGQILHGAGKGRVIDPVLRQILLSEFPEEPNRTPWEKAKEK